MAKAAPILLAAWGIWVSTAPLAAAQYGTLQIYVRNDADVANDTLDEARRVVSEIYSEAGLTLSWCSDDCAVTIALRPRASDDTARRAKDAMGYTPGGGEERGRLAFVLINRVNEVADRYRTPKSIVLGAAIAHELGHLLISKEHTNTGIMKAYLNQSDFRKARQGELRLTAEQARHIRILSACVAPSEGVADGTTGLNGWTRGAAADSPQSAVPRPTLNLELRNMTTLSPAVLGEARETLTQIYYAAGIGVQWKTVEPDFTVFVISTPPPAVRVSGFALGYVPGNKARRGRQAFVLADRVRNRSSELVVSLQLVLGLTMAHEVAHLLMPHESHSVNGLMRSVWNAFDYRRASFGQLLFTDEEAQLMRDRLSAEPVGGPSRALKCQDAASSC